MDFSSPSSWWESRSSGGFALLSFGVFASPAFFRPNLLFALGALGMGYVLPGMALARLAKRRQHRIRLALPDALDLLVVSVEAGLGLGS